MDLDHEKLERVTQEAFNATDNLRWQMAITKAKLELESNPYMHFDGHALLVLSPSGEIYTANGTCQCKAYRHGQQPCWHRAAARLVERYLEAQQSGDAIPLRDALESVRCAARIMHGIEDANELSLGDISRVCRLLFDAEQQLVEATAEEVAAQ
jgi:hypothetical protein